MVEATDPTQVPEVGGTWKSRVIVEILLASLTHEVFYIKVAILCFYITTANCSELSGWTYINVSGDFSFSFKH